MIFNRLVVSIVALLVVGCGSLTNEKLTKFERKVELDWVVANIEANYAPLEYKQKLHGFDFEEEKKKFAKRAEEDMTNHEFNVLLKEFVALFKDGHVNLMTSWNSLPGTMNVAHIGLIGGLVEVDINIIEEPKKDSKDKTTEQEKVEASKKKADKTPDLKEVFYVKNLLPTMRQNRVGFPVMVGDYIYKIDGKSVDAYVSEYCPANIGNDLSNKNIRFRNLQIFSSVMCKMPEADSVELTIYRGGKEIKETVSWVKKDYADFVKEQREASKNLPKAENQTTDVDSDFENLKNRISSRYSWSYDQYLSNLIFKDERALVDIARDQFIIQVPTADLFLSHIAPLLEETKKKEEATKKNEKETVTNGTIMQLKVENKFFDTRIFFMGDKKIGYIKIPGFSGGDTAVAAFAEALAKFKDFNVSGKIIDLVDNGGGSLLYGMNLAALLKEENHKEMSVKVRLNDGWVNNFHSSSLYNSSEYMRSHFDRIYGDVLEAQEKDQRLSNSLSLRDIMPSIKKATGAKGEKVVLMVNEMCASMCDIFTADLKDNGIAKIIGTQTMGAGGNVTPHLASPRLGNVLSTTESLIVRHNGELLENKGVKPDLEYKKSLNDFNNKNIDFINAAVKYALK